MLIRHFVFVLCAEYRSDRRCGKPELAPRIVELEEIPLAMMIVELVKVPFHARIVRSVADVTSFWARVPKRLRIGAKRAAARRRKAVRVPNDGAEIDAGSYNGIGRESFSIQFTIGVSMSKGRSKRCRHNAPCWEPDKAS